MEHSISFGNLFSQAFKNFLSRFPLYFGFILIFAGIQFGLPYAIEYLRFYAHDFAPLVFVRLFYGVLSFLLNGFFGIINVLAILHVAQNESATFLSAIQFAFQYFWKSIATALRVFWYTFKWSLIPAIILLVLYAFFQQFWMMAPSASAADILKMDPRNFVPFSIGSSTLPQAVSFIFNIIGFVFLVTTLYFAISRGTRSTFSLYALTRDQLSPKDALHKSIQMVNGKFWFVFGYILLLQLLLMIIFSLPIWIIAGIAKGDFLEGMAYLNMIPALRFISLILAGFLGAVSVQFMSLFYGKMKG